MVSTELYKGFFAVVLSFAACKKEEIITITQSTGKVIGRSINVPVSGIKVAVSDGQYPAFTVSMEKNGIHTSHPRV